MICRICGAKSVNPVGEVEYISGYAWMAYDCAACGCRFTKHDDSVYNILHESGAISYYCDYRELAQQCLNYFSKRDREGLKSFLSCTPKYRFVIERVSKEPPDICVLEVGSSRGYLTSYFILDGRRILGVDVSHEAVEFACGSFGEHFAVADDPAVKASGPYDVVYHVGMIGCVADPIGLTRQLLSILRPGGKLLFNAPNRAALHLRKQLWLDSAPPPDLVTLFPQGFWTRHFSESAYVSEEVETTQPNQSLHIALRRLSGSVWRKPVPKPLEHTSKLGHSWSQEAGPLRHLLERAVLKAGRLSGLAVLVPQRPADFGLFVTMIRK